MGTIMKTMMFSSLLCIFAKFQSRKNAYNLIIQITGKRQNDVERRNTFCSRKVELSCIERSIYVQMT